MLAPPGWFFLVLIFSATMLKVAVPSVMLHLQSGDPRLQLLNSEIEFIDQVRHLINRSGALEV